jgi:ubiquitin carboxyl-terminal hydrolase 1
MSYNQEWASRSPFPTHHSTPTTSDFERKLALAAILLLFGSLVLSLLDSWPSTIKRLIWETLVFLTPARLIYAVEYAMVKHKRLPGEEPGFRPEHFGDHQAKVEALQRILRLDDSQFTTTFRRVRAFSGITKMIGGTATSRPSGLGNWDNSCYQNSVLQGLASLPAFRTFVNYNLEGMKDQDEYRTHRALKDIMERLNATDGHLGTLWTPSALKSMDSWQQQDAQEYFSKLMDAVDDEISKSMKRRKLDSGFEATSQTARWLDINSLPAWNPLEGLLAQRVACKQCGHAEGLSLLPFNCLTINMGGQYEYDLEELLDEHTALENIEGVECIKCTLLQARSRLEQLLSKPAISNTPDESGDTSKIRTIAANRLAVIQKVFEDDTFSESGILKRCNISAKNQVSSVKSKQVALARPPKDLVIHINRSIFDDFGNQRKNTASVRFPLAFNLGRWCLGVKSSNADVKEFEHWSMTSTESMLPLSEDELLGLPTFYELRCVVTHQGRHENGHYVAYGRRRPGLSQTGSDTDKAGAVDDQWYCFNDEFVTAVSKDDVLNKGNVFILFYEAVEGSQSHQHSDSVDEHKLADAPMETSFVDDIEQMQEPERTLQNHGEAAEKDFLDSFSEEKVAEGSSTSGLDIVQGQSENGTPKPCEAPERAPNPVTGSPASDNPPTGSGVASVMRTSSASPRLARMERRQSGFVMSPSSIISAI